jgi:hypothetical protein
MEGRGRITVAGKRVGWGGGKWERGGDWNGKGFGGEGRCVMVSLL